MARLAVYSQSYWRSGGSKPQTDFESVNLKINPPRVVFDNDTDDTSTILTVDSANKQGCLLEVVQLLTDLQLVILKAQISSDGGWFVDVFHITDQQGFKVSDPKTISFIQESLGAAKAPSAPIDVPTSRGPSQSLLDPGRLKHTGIELSGVDRPGLLHDLATEIANLGCSVLAAEVWTHNGRVAFVIYVTGSSGAPVTDPAMVGILRSRLKAVMASGDGSLHSPVATVMDGRTHASRRMHQIMFAERDFETGRWQSMDEEDEAVPLRPKIAIRNSPDLGYSIINVKCSDRAKLLFDTVCTLTDMQYIIHHATIESDNGIASQEYFLRSMDGGLLESEAERERLMKCLSAAIQRHTPAGICLELRASDRVGLLADVTGIFKERGISVAAATVSTQSGKAMNEFFVVAEDGGPVDRKIIEAVQRQVGPTSLAIRDPPSSTPGSPAHEEPVASFSFTSLLRVQSERLLASLGLTTPSTSL